MEYSKTLPEFTATFEGYSWQSTHHSEDPPNRWTLGYGSTYWPDVHGAMFPVKEGMQCNSTEALSVLGMGLESAAKCVNMSVTVPITQGEFDGLTDFCYNLGCQRWMGSTARSLLNAGNYEGAAAALEMWSRAGGKVMAGLLKRRLAEEALFKTPDQVSAV